MFRGPCNESKEKEAADYADEKDIGGEAGIPQLRFPVFNQRNLRHLRLSFSF